MNTPVFLERLRRKLVWIACFDSIFAQVCKDNYDYSYMYSKFGTVGILQSKWSMFADGSHKISLELQRNIDYNTLALAVRDSFKVVVNWCSY